MMTRLMSRLPLCRNNAPARRLQAAEPSLPTRLGIAGAILSQLPLQLHGFYEVARGEIILHTTAQAVYDSNIYTRKDSDSDLYLSLLPELQFLRHAGRGTIDARAGINFTRFIDFTQENFEDFHATLNLTYPVSPDSPLSGAMFIGYTERTDVNDFLNTRVQARDIGFGTDSLYRVSERLSIRNSLRFEDTDFDGFSGTRNYGGSLGIQWLYSEKLSFFTDYRLQRDESDGDDTVRGQKIDNLNHALLFGAIGTLRPRVTGIASVGFQRTNSRGDERDRNLLIASADLEWLWRPKTTLALGISRQLDVSPADETVERSDIRLRAIHDLNEKIRLSAHTGYRHLEFNTTKRLDNAGLAGAGIQYNFTRYWNAGADLELVFNSSNRVETDYNRQIAQIYTRYSF